MSDGDRGALLLILAIPVGWLFAAIGWDAVLNMPTKKKLLDEYATEGADSIAFVLEQNVTTFRTHFIPTRKKHLIRYAYKVAGSDQVYVKDYNRMHAACGIEIKAVTPVFPIKILRGMPRSGIPKFRVEDRNEEYGEMARTATIVKAMFGVTFSSLLFMTGTMTVDTSTPADLLLPFLIFLFLGCPCAPYMFDGWKREILETVVQESASIQLPMLRRRRRRRRDDYAAIATTEAMVVHHVAAQATDIPLVEATPVGPGSSHGDRSIEAMEIGTARAIRIDPSIPDQSIG